METEINMDKILKEKIALHEKYLVRKYYDVFIKQIEKETGWTWVPLRIETIVEGKGLTEIVAMHIEGNVVYSVLAYYELEEYDPNRGECPYIGFDVDVSHINDVRDILGEEVILKCLEHQRKRQQP